MSFNSCTKLFPIIYGLSAMITNHTTAWLLVFGSCKLVIMFYKVAVFLQTNYSQFIKIYNRRLGIEIFGWRLWTECGNNLFCLNCLDNSDIFTISSKDRFVYDFLPIINFFFNWRCHISKNSCTIYDLIVPRFHLKLFLGL